MFGFPAADRYDGVGVFSRTSRSSPHAPAPPESHDAAAAARGEPLVWGIRGRDGSADGADGGRGARRAVVRPVYRKGAEVLVYLDCDHVHSTPDEAYRYLRWRFM